MNRICSTRAELCTGSRSVSNKLKSKVSRGVKIRSHLASKSTFASVFASNFNIVSVITLTLMQRMEIEPILCICFCILLSLLLLLPPANEVCEGYVFTRVCQSFCSWGGWYPGMPCRWYPSIPCRSPEGGGVYPSMPCRFPGPHPRGKLRGLAGGGGSPDPHPTGMHSCF